MLAAQKADYLFGGGLIVLAFSVQFASFFVPPEAMAFGASQGRLVPWAMAAITVCIFFLLRVVAGRVAKYYEDQIIEWLKQQRAIAG